MAQALNVSAEEEEVLRRKLLILHNRWLTTAEKVKDFGQKVAADDHEASRDSLAQLSKSLMFFQNWIARQNAIESACQVDQQDCRAQRAHQEEAIIQAANDIETSKKDLDAAKLLRQQNEEYESLKHQIMQHQSRSTTVQQCQQLEADIHSLEDESLRLDLLADKRRKQFSLLYQCLEDLVELDNNEDAVEDSVETEKRKSKRGRNDDDEDEEDEDEDDKEAKDDRMLD